MIEKKEGAWEQAKKTVGKKAKWSPKSGIIVDVEIVDVRQSYGTIKYTIRPIAGGGMTRVAKSNSLEIYGY